MKIFLSTADQSGDYHGALLAAALRRLDPDVELYGVGGELMAAEGVNIVVNPLSHAVIGFFEVIRSLATWKEYLCQAVAAVRVRPDRIVLIDSPSFNLRLAGRLKRRGYRFFYYISPQVWAWGAGRTKVIADICEKVLVIFPFEEDIYRRAGARKAVFVGHPFLDTVKPREDRDQVRNSFNLEPGKPLLLLLPGSRISEVRAVLPVMAGVARALGGKNGICQAAVYAAGARVAAEIRQAAPDLTVLEGGDKHGLFASADLALAASGSVTLELTLLGTPYLLLYRLSRLTYTFLRPIVKVRWAGITNILAGKLVVPEFIQGRCRVDSIVPTARKMLEKPGEREKLSLELAQVRQLLGNPGAVERAAAEILGRDREDSEPVG